MISIIGNLWQASNGSGKAITFIVMIIIVNLLFQLIFHGNSIVYSTTI